MFLLMPVQVIPEGYPVLIEQMVYWRTVSPYWACPVVHLPDLTSFSSCWVKATTIWRRARQSPSLHEVKPIDPMIQVSEVEG
jgi:hypothetical protein